MADEWRRIDILIEKGTPRVDRDGRVIPEDDSAIRSWRMTWSGPGASWYIRLDNERVFMMTARNHIILCIKP